MTMADLVKLLPEVAAPVLARQHQEKELTTLMDIFADIARRAQQG